MGPKAKQPAATPEPAARIPFNPSTQELILDLKGCCALPSDQETTATCSFRAIIMPIGKYVHEPNKPGRYAVLGSFRSVTALCLVHFDESLQREPELLLHFLDHGLADAKSMHGVMVMTVQLPLLESANVYSKVVRSTPAADVAAFQPIATNKLPYSRDLRPFLQTIELYRLLAITNQSELLAFISSALGQRLVKLVKIAKDALEALVAEMAVQDEAVAAAQREALTTRLDALDVRFTNLPPEAYDAPLTQRIKTLITVEPDAHEAETVGVPAWINTPLKIALKEGKADSQFTRFSELSPVREVPRRSPRAQAPAPPGEGAGSGGGGGSGSVDLLSDASGDSDESSSDSSASARLADDPSPIGKRKRSKADFYVPLPPAGKAKGKGKEVQPKQSKAKAPKVDKNAKGKDRSCPPGTDPEAPFGRNKKGKAYKRPCGAYSSSLVPKLNKTTTDKTSNVLDKVVHDLREANKELTTQLADALANNAILKASEGHDAKIARLEETSARHENYHKAYMEGLQQGIQMASGRFVVPPSAGFASGAAPSSVP